jgi:hypothetical protein
MRRHASSAKDSECGFQEKASRDKLGLAQRWLYIGQSCSIRASTDRGRDGVGLVPEVRYECENSKFRKDVEYCYQVQPGSTV